MGSFGALRTTIAVVGLVALALSGCSSAKKSTPPTTASSTAPSSSTSTSVGPAPSTTRAATTSSTAATLPTTTTPSSSVRITGFTVSPAAPVCNGPTMVQLSWTAIDAVSVGLAIDGSKFASYGGGSQSHLEYFACDGHPHTYQLTALGKAGSAPATATKIVRAASG